MTEPGKVEVVATLQLPDGRIFQVHYDCDSDHVDTQEFIWNDGNFACDCNRALFLNRQHGLGLDVSCSEDRIELLFLEVGGRVIYDPRTEAEAND